MWRRTGTHASRLLSEIYCDSGDLACPTKRDLVEPPPALPYRKGLLSEHYEAVLGAAFLCRRRLGDVWRFAVGMQGST